MMPFSTSSSSPPPPFLMPLVLLHHILVDTRWPHGDKACLSCAPQPARKHRCRKRPEAPSATAQSKQMTKLASALCILPLGSHTHGDTPTLTKKKDTQYVPGTIISLLCVYICAKRGNDHFSTELDWKQNWIKWNQEENRRLMEGAV